MTTTAHEDRFIYVPKPDRELYITTVILRRNVADLEIALRKQTERAEKAEAELAKMREQKPALHMAFSDCGNFIRYWTRDTKNLEATMAVNDFEVLGFYTAPVPAPAPAVNEGGWKRFTDDDLAEIHQLAYELGGTDSGEYLLDGDQLDQVVVKCASLFYAFHVQSAPAPAVLDDIHELAYELGGTDSGEYHLEPESLDKIIAAVQVMAAVPAPAVPDIHGIVLQLTLAETEMLNAKAWSPGSQAKRHIDFAITAIGCARALLQSAEVTK